MWIDPLPHSLWGVVAMMLDFEYAANIASSNWYGQRHTHYYALLLQMMGVNKERVY